MISYIFIDCITLAKQGDDIVGSVRLSLHQCAFSQQRANISVHSHSKEQRRIIITPRCESRLTFNTINLQ